MWKRLLQLLGLVPREPEQTTWCWCECGAELCSTESFVSDDGRGVCYACSSCGKESWWNFDFPVPIKLEGPMEEPTTHE